MTPSYQQPKSLYLLFFIELWERFSFYGLQATLVLYLIKKFNLPDASASSIYGTFVALGYTLPILGGFIADKIIGHQRALLLGSLFIILANAVLALPWFTAIIWGLGLLITGTGLFKSNVSTLLGYYYTDDDPRRNSGFTLFYMGINFGAAGGPLVYGQLAQTYGFSYAFLAGSIGMLLGFIVFQKQKGILHREATHDLLPMPSRKQWSAVILGILLVFIVSCILINYTAAIKELLLAFGLLLMIFQLSLAYKVGGTAGKKIVALLLLTLMGMCFYTIILQLGSSFTLFTDRNVTRTVLGYTIPTASFVSLEALTVILFSPLVAWLWLHLHIKKINLSEPSKFAIGLLFASLSFVLLVMGANVAMRDGFCSPLWIVGMYILQGIGDIVLSPIGLSSVTTLALPNMIGFFMGVWMVGIAIGGFLAGKISSILLNVNDISQLTPIAQAGVYHQLFKKELSIALVVTLISIMLIPLIKFLLKNRVDSKTDVVL